MNLFSITLCLIRKIKILYIFLECQYNGYSPNSDMEQLKHAFFLWRDPRSGSTAPGIAAECVPTAAAEISDRETTRPSLTGGQDSFFSNELDRVDDWFNVNFLHPTG